MKTPDFLLFQLFGLVLILFSTCKNEPALQTLGTFKLQGDTLIYTAYSDLPNTYSTFNSPRAINTIAAIENEYFRRYEEDGSAYYGTIWREQAEKISLPLISYNRYKVGWGTSSELFRFR